MHHLPSRNPKWATDRCYSVGLTIGVNFVIKVGGLMASAEREAITGVWGQSPWSGGLRPPEAESILSFTSANGGANLPIFVTL